MRDTEESLSDAEQWLKDYTFQSLDKWPEDEVIRELQSAHPYSGGTLYRGLNFGTVEQFERFMTTTAGGTCLDETGITSWGKVEDVATQFCLTRPTYFLDRDMMEAEAARGRTSDYMIGNAGVVLRVDVPAHVGIDVGKTKFVKENEVILPAGHYKVSIHRLYRPFAETITDENYKQEFLQILDITNNNRDALKFDHILYRFPAIDDEMRQHMYQLLTGASENIKANVGCTETNDNITGNWRNKLINIWVQWNVDPSLVERYTQLLPQHQEKLRAQFSAVTEEIDHQFDEVTRSLDLAGKPFYLLADNSLTSAIAAGLIRPSFPQTVNSAISEFYNHLNSAGEIAKIKTSDDLHTFRKLIGHALSQMVPSPRDELHARREAAIRERSARRPAP